MKAIFTVSAESAGAVKAAKTTALKSALRRDSMFPLLVRVLFQALAAPRVLQKLPFRDSLSSSGFSDRATVRGSIGTGDRGPAIGLRREEKDRASSSSPEGDGYRRTRIIIIGVEPARPLACGRARQRRPGSAREPAPGGEA